MAKRNYGRDISADALKKLVRVNGDEIVTGYTRGRKVHTIKDFKAVKEHADRTLSVITGGRPINNERTLYAAKLRFRYWILLLILLAGGLLTVLVRVLPDTKNVKAEEETSEEVSSEEETTYEIRTEKDYSNLYVHAPGFTDLAISKDEQIHVYNPDSNTCRMQYFFDVDGKTICESGVLYPGEAASIAIGTDLQSGDYMLTIYTVNTSIDGETVFNSLSQQINLNIL